jgi:hypothetical protein
MKALALFLFLAGAGVALCWSASCSPPPDARIGIDAPAETLFPPVADLLAYRCGSLDCHGSPQRNFIIWSCYGLRLDEDAAPGCRQQGGSNTTPEEYLATYDSLVALEPAVMSQVVASGGADPDLLTFVRKARGEEEHKGGKLWDPGSVDDDCVTSWLASVTDGGTAATCALGLAEDLEAGTR